MKIEENGAFWKCSLIMSENRCQRLKKLTNQKAALESVFIPDHSGSPIPSTRLYFVGVHNELLRSNINFSKTKWLQKPGIVHIETDLKKKLW